MRLGTTSRCSVLVAATLLGEESSGSLFTRQTGKPANARRLESELTRRLVLIDGCPYLVVLTAHETTVGI